MSELPQHSEQDLADVTALADGSLDAGRRAEVEARVASSVELTEELRRQRRALELVVDAQRSVQAPGSLRAAIGEIKPGRRPRFSLRRLGFAGAALAAMALAVVLLVLPGSVSGDAIIAQAAAAHTRPAEGPAPPEQQGSPTLLDFERFGVVFPAWRDKFQWDVVGERSDRVEGRDVATVLYRKEAASIGYSVISGDRLTIPKDARSVVQEGSTVAVFSRGDRTVALVERGGHTCVVSAVGVPEATLVELAAWKGKGTVPFA